MWIIDAWEKAERSLCVDCVAKVTAWGERDGFAAGNAVEAVIELVEIRMGVPGFVEVKHVDGVAQGSP